MRAGAALVALLAVAGVAPATAQDVLAVAALEGAPGQTRAVPVTVRDLAGTLLDEGDGPDLEIQGFAFRVDFAPAGADHCGHLRPGGGDRRADAGLPGDLALADHIVVLMNFDVETAPLAFTLGAPAPGNVVGELRFGISAAAPPGTLVTLALESARATLVNDSATLSETVANGQLALLDGAILVDASVFADGFESGGLGGWSSHLP